MGQVPSENREFIVAMNIAKDHLAGLPEQLVLDALRDQYVQIGRPSKATQALPTLFEGVREKLKKLPRHQAAKVLGSIVMCQLPKSWVRQERWIDPTAEMKRLGVQYPARHHFENYKSLEGYLEEDVSGYTLLLTEATIVMIQLMFCIVSLKIFEGFEGINFRKCSFHRAGVNWHDFLGGREYRMEILRENFPSMGYRRRRKLSNVDFVDIPKQFKPEELQKIMDVITGV